VQLLQAKRAPKYLDNWEDTFDWFQERVTIEPKLWKPNSDGEIKWKQAIRNIAKVHPNAKTPNALTEGELIVFKGGGFALPNHVPKGKEVVEFPQLHGLAIPRVKPKPRLTKSGNPKHEREAAAFIDAIEQMGTSMTRILKMLKGDR
jgi:hypothetical protein